MVHMNSTFVGGGNHLLSFHFLLKCDLIKIYYTWLQVSNFIIATPLCRSDFPGINASLETPHPNYSLTLLEVI